MPKISKTTFVEYSFYFLLARVSILAQDTKFDEKLNLALVLFHRVI